MQAEITCFVHFFLPSLFYFIFFFSTHEDRSGGPVRASAHRRKLPNLHCHVHGFVYTMQRRISAITNTALRRRGVKNVRMQLITTAVFAVGKALGYASMTAVQERIWLRLLSANCGGPYINVNQRRLTPDQLFRPFNFFLFIPFNINFADICYRIVNWLRTSSHKFCNPNTKKRPIIKYRSKHTTEN